MVESLTYREDDDTRWGGGQGSDLDAIQVDINFWTLFSAIQAFEDHQEVSAGIDFISQPIDGNVIFFHLTDHRVLGPFTLPTAEWTPRGEWLPLTPYAPFDVVSNNGSTYLVTVQHVSAATFNPFATDGDGHALYVLILASPANSLPVGGTGGQRLVKAVDSPDYTTEWRSDFVRMHIFVGGQPLPNELLLQYTVVDNMVMPLALTGSAVFEGVPAVAACSYGISLNGNPIGSIDFSGGSPEEISITFSTDVACQPGDVISLNGPGTPDINQANISFTLVALLT